MDFLLLENILLDKKEQDALSTKKEPRTVPELD